MAADRGIMVNGWKVGDLELFRRSPFLAGLLGDGTWKELQESPADRHTEGFAPSIREFRRKLRRMLEDPENALQSLRQFRVRTMLALAKTDLEGGIKPHQVRARLRALSETMVLGAWWLAEANMRQKFVHPLIYEKRNINPPMAIFSLSRLGAGDPWYSTGPSPLFVHSRATEYSPALTEKDFMMARRSGKEWLPAREYFHGLARRTMSYLSVPTPAGKGFGHMSEDVAPEDDAPPLPGALVVLFSAFEEYFSSGLPIKERLSLMRLRFLVGQERLGRAVEAAAKTALIKTVLELGARLPAGVNAYYRDRAKAEGLPLIKGGILDIERRLRVIQLTHAVEAPELLDPSPLKTMDLLARFGLIGGDDRLVLHRSYSAQWYLMNRLSLLGWRSSPNWDELYSGSLDGYLDVREAGARLTRLIREARVVLDGLNRGST